MYHTRKASKRLDKVYALLGMSNDDPYTAGLEANYKSSWKDVFLKLIYFCLSDQISVSVWDNDEVAVIQAKGCVLGEVSLVEEDPTRDDGKHVVINWKYAPSRSYMRERQSSCLIFQAAAKVIEKGDIVCGLHGASAPTIIRLHNGFSTIIMSSVPLTADLRN